jgi:RND family efflux transporter MFP subunit
MAEDELQQLRRTNQSLTRELLAVYEELDLLHTLASIFATSDDVDEMGRRLVDEAVENLGAAAGFLIFTGEGMEEFDPVLQGASAEEVQAFVQVAAPKVLQGEAVLLDHALAEGFEPRPLLVVPLRSRDGIFGALGLMRADGGQAFTAGEKKALSVLATQAGGVILQKRNLDLTYLSERLRKTNEGLQTLLDISRELTATLDVSRVLSAMVNLPGQVVPYDRASISLKEGNRWRLRAVSGMAEPERNRPEIRTLESLHVWVGERGEPVRFEMGEGADEVPELFREALGRAQMASFQALPLADEEGTLGILALERSEGGRLPEGTEDVLAVLANQATVALRNAQLYSQVPLIGVLERIVEKRRRFAGMSHTRRLVWLGGVAAVTAALILVPVPFHVRGSCRLVPARTLSVSSAVPGRVARVDVEEGEAVTKGQILARLDDRDLRLQQGEARARVLTAQRRVLQMEASQHPESAALERVRLERLRREEELAAAALGETNLEAPGDGVVLTPRVREFVGQRLESGDVFCILAALDPLEVEVAVPEVDAGSLVVGRPAQIKLDAYPHRTFPAEVVAIRPAAEEREGRQVVVARLRVENPDRGLRPGMMGKARVHVRQASLGRYLFRRPLRWLRSLLWV